MSVSIHQIRDEFDELTTQICEGNDTGKFAQRDRSLSLADQLAARTLRLRADLLGGRLPEALALRELGTEGDFRARLLALDEAIHMVVGAAQDTLDAVTADDFPRARQRVFRGCLPALATKRRLGGHARAGLHAAHVVRRRSRQPRTKGSAMNIAEVTSPAQQPGQYFKST